MSTMFIAWAISLCITGLLFLLAFRIWLFSDESRDIVIKGYWRDEAQKAIEWLYANDPDWRDGR